MSGAPDDRGVFNLPQRDREALLVAELSDLTAYFRDRVPGYARLLSALGHQPGRRYETVADLPWLPVRLFKEHTLKAVPDDEVFAVLTSSGTTGAASRVFLDRSAAARQQEMLAATLRVVLGPRRLPTLFVDAASTLDRNAVRATRAAALLGMLVYSRGHAFLLDSDGRIDEAALRSFLSAHGERPFLVFGFTYLVWEHLRRAARLPGVDLHNAVVVHTGGWKKLADRAVDNVEFRRALIAAGVGRIHGYYGMVEQIGTVFVEGATTHQLYCPDFADVLVRDPQTWQPVPVGTPGLIQVMSTVPRSHPGHVLLTEDVGVVHGVDDGDWPGKRFSVLGRLPKAEARGCSDTLPDMGLAAA